MVLGGLYYVLEIARLCLFCKTLNKRMNDGTEKFLFTHLYNIKIQIEN